MHFDEAKEAKSREKARKKKSTINTTLDWVAAFSMLMAVWPT